MAERALAGRLVRIGPWRPAGPEQDRTARAKPKVISQARCQDDGPAPGQDAAPAKPRGSSPCRGTRERRQADHGDGGKEEEPGQHGLAGHAGRWRQAVTGRLAALLHETGDQEEGRARKRRVDKVVEARGKSARFQRARPPPSSVPMEATTAKAASGRAACGCRGGRPSRRRGSPEPPDDEGRSDLRTVRHPRRRRDHRRGRWRRRRLGHDHEKSGSRSRGAGIGTPAATSAVAQAPPWWRSRGRAAWRGLEQPGIRGGDLRHFTARSAMLRVPVTA